MFDLNQHRVERIFNEKFGIPVLHYTQLLGLAMGISPEELAIQDLRVKASSIIETLFQ
jgi:heterodisulfide reductase subunit B